MSINKDIYFNASAEIARRTGVIKARYRTKDGRFIITDKDLNPVRLTMTPDEYVNGLDIKKITEATAKRLISANGYQLGEELIVETAEETAEEQQAETASEEETSNEEEETT